MSSLTQNTSDLHLNGVEMKLEMAGNKIYVILKPVESQSKEITRDDGETVELVLPDKHSEQTRVGVIQAVGPDCPKDGEGNFVFDADDIIIIPFYAGVALHLVMDDITDDTHRIITSREILAKVVLEEN